MKRWAWTALTAVLCMLWLSFSVAAQTAVTSLEFSNSAAVAEENLSLSGYGDKESGYAPSTIGGRLYASVSGTDLRKLEWSKGEYGAEGMQPVMTGGTKNPWGAGAYFELRTSTVGYENVTFSAKLGATNKGPRDYKLQYSLDGITFKDVAGATFTVTANKTMFEAFDAVALPTDAANAQTLVIRVTVASNMMVNGTAGLIGSTGGETAINAVTLCGDPIAAADEEPTTTESHDATVSAATTTAPVTEPTIPNVNTGEGGAATIVMGIALAAVLTVLAVLNRTHAPR